MSVGAVWDVVEAFLIESPVVVDSSTFVGSNADGTNHCDIAGDTLFVVADAKVSHSVVW